MRVLALLALVVALAGLAYLLASSWAARRAHRRGDPWRVETVTRTDGTLAVVVRRAGCEHVRVVREFAAAMDSVEVASELRLAREDAQLQADELNRPAP